MTGERNVGSPRSNKQTALFRGVRGMSTRGWCSSGPPLVVRPTVGLFCPPLLPPDVSHTKGPGLGAVVCHRSGEEPWWSVWSCLSPG